MRFLRFLFVGNVSIMMMSCSNDRIKISADFDRGSIGNFEEIDPGFIKGTTKHWLKRDSIGDQYYWFYFKVDNVQNRKVTFELSNLEGIYRGNPHVIYSDYTQPVMSYDQENWDRIEEVTYDSAAHIFTFAHTFNSEPVWIAYAHPYSYTRLHKQKKTETSKCSQSRILLFQFMRKRQSS